MSDSKYVAFDVHQATISAAVLNLEGKRLTQTVMQTEAATIRDFLRGLSGTVQLTFEEGTPAHWLFDADVLVCNPRENQALKNGNKSDRIDDSAPDDSAEAGGCRAGDMEE